MPSFIMFLYEIYQSTTCSSPSNSDVLGLKPIKVSSVGMSDCRSTDARIGNDVLADLLRMCPISDSNVWTFT